MATSNKNSDAHENSSLIIGNEVSFGQRRPIGQPWFSRCSTRSWASTATPVRLQRRLFRDLFSPSQVLTSTRRRTNEMRIPSGTLSPTCTTIGTDSSTCTFHPRLRVATRKEDISGRRRRGRGGRSMKRREDARLN